MFYIIGFLRRTPLYGLMALPISIFVFNAHLQELFSQAFGPTSFAGFFGAFLIWSIVAYPLFVAIHLLCVKLTSSNRDLVEAYFSALGQDLIAPFRYVGLFLLVITKKHKINDNSDFHEICDLLQIVFGFIWVLVMIVYFWIGFLNIGSL